MPAANSFNTEQYAWSSTTIQIGNRVLTGVQGVRYKKSQEKGFVHGKGSNPLSIQRGNFTFEGSLKLLQSELELLVAGAKNQDLLAYRNLTVSIGYELEDGTGTAVVDNLVGVEFMDVEKAMDQGKQFMEIELPFIFLAVDYNV